jgi:hypothetical protein
MRQDSDTTLIVCRRDFDQNRVLYTYGRNSKELKNDGLAFLGSVFESMIEQANLKDDAEEVGVMVHMRMRPIEKDDRWYKIDFVMQDDGMAYYSNFDGRLPNEFVHVVPLSGGLPQSMFIAVEALDEMAYAHAVDAKIFDEENEVGLPQDQTTLSDFGLELSPPSESIEGSDEEDVFVLEKKRNRAWALPLPGPTSKATGRK